MKKLRKLKEKLAPTFQKFPWGSQATTKLLKDLGFKSGKRYPHVFINKKTRLVVKECCFMNEHIPVGAIPTIRLIPKKNKCWVIQPLARLLNAKERAAYNKMEDKWPQCDSHDRNVGFYRNRLVLIDW